MFKRVDRNSFSLISALSKANERRLEKAVLPLLKKVFIDVAGEMKDGGDIVNVTNRITQFMDEKLASAQAMIALSFAVKAYKLAGKLLGIKRFVNDSKSLTSESVSTSFWGGDLLIAQNMRQDINNWILQTSKIENATSARMIQSIWRSTMIDTESGAGVSSIVSEFLSRGLAQTESRARLIAMTTSAWAHNNGANQLYADEGISQSAWLTTEDDLACPACVSMDGKRADVRQPFDISGTGLNVPFPVITPPLHPHCRCTIVPVVDVGEILSSLGSAA